MDQQIRSRFAVFAVLSLALLTIVVAVTSDAQEAATSTEAITDAQPIAVEPKVITGYPPGQPVILPRDADGHVIRPVFQRPLAGEDGGVAGGFSFEEPGCLVCHGNLEDVARNMAGIFIPCTFCHGGNFDSDVKEIAHVQPTLPVIMDNTVAPLDYDLPYQKFVNPSNLRVVETACAVCHFEQYERVMKSLMATAAGHYAGGLYQNGVVDTKTPVYGTFAVSDNDGIVPTERGAVQSLLDLIRYDPEGDPQLVATHFAAVPAQACARCHLWSRGKGYRGAVGAEGTYRADGCVACHMPYANDGRSESADASINHEEQGHPRIHQITKRIPTEQCLHCHHRGARIGLTFTGRAQMPPRLPSGPEVPGTTDVIFNGNYHYADPDVNPQDIHGERGMHCIDCHTKSEIMGDGNIYGHMDQATKIECRTCHGTPDARATLLDIDGAPLRNIEYNPEGTVVLTSKVTGTLHTPPQPVDFTDPFSPNYNPRAACAMNDNHIKPEGGLACYACHSSWVSNCFGCHFERDEREMGRNLVTREWEVGKARTNDKVFESLKYFFMGPNAKGRVSPYIVGCQPIADVTAPDGSKILDFKMPETAAGLSGIALNPVQPHSVRGVGEVRTCVECHRSPPTLGLGSGNYSLARTYVYTATAGGIQVFERWSEPTNPVPQSMLSTGTARGIASLPNGINGDPDFLYVVSENADLSIFDMREGIPETPAVVVPGINAIDVSRVARYLYVVVEGVGVQIFDNQDPLTLTPVTTVSIPSAVRAVPWGIHLFVAAGDAGLVVVDVSDHQAPSIVATLGGMSAVDVTLYAHFQGGSDFAVRAYVADPGYGVRVVDLLPNFDTPALVGGMSLHSGAWGLDTYTRYVTADEITPSREHDYLYVAAGTSGLRVFDMTNPDAIGEVGTVSDLGGFAMDVDVSSQISPPGVDDYAMVANSELGMQVVDVTDPVNPVYLTTVGAPASRVFVAVQQMDRFIDEQGTPLKDNSHPGIGTFTHADIVRILGIDNLVPDCGIPGDIDLDDDSDLDDYALFHACFSGPDMPAGVDCENAQLDRDADVDLADIALYLRSFTGQR